MFLIIVLTMVIVTLMMMILMMMMMVVTISRASLTVIQNRKETESSLGNDGNHWLKESQTSALISLAK